MPLYSILVLYHISNFVVGNCVRNTLLTIYCVTTTGMINNIFQAGWVQTWILLSVMLFCLWLFINNRFFIISVRMTRNAMGEYIVPSGGKPLTSLGQWENPNTCLLWFFWNIKTVLSGHFVFLSSHLGNKTWNPKFFSTTNSATGPPVLTKRHSWQNQMQ